MKYVTLIKKIRILAHHTHKPVHRFFSVVFFKKKTFACKTLSRLSFPVWIPKKCVSFKHIKYASQLMNEKCNFQMAFFANLQNSQLYRHFYKCLNFYSYKETEISISKQQRLRSSNDQFCNEISIVNFSPPLSFVRSLFLYWGFERWRNKTIDNQTIEMRKIQMTSSGCAKLILNDKISSMQLSRGCKNSRWRKFPLTPDRLLFCCSTF